MPVSVFNGREDGTFPCGTAAYEKRGVAVDVPEWQPDKCIQCNQCSYVCPHASIRPFLLTEEEVAAAPEAFNAVAPKGLKGADGLKFRMQVSVLDCLGCGSCAEVCPAPGKALIMKPLATQEAEIDNWDYAVDKVAPKANPANKGTVKGSQFEQPLLEFSGACAGCGETHADSHIKAPCRRPTRCRAETSAPVHAEIISFAAPPINGTAFREADASCRRQQSRQSSQCCQSYH